MAGFGIGHIPALSTLSAFLATPLGNGDGAFCSAHVTDLLILGGSSHLQKPFEPVERRNTDHSSPHNKTDMSKSQASAQCVRGFSQGFILPFGQERELSQLNALITRPEWL